MKVFDTSSFPVEDRAEAFQATVSQNCSTSAASFEDLSEIHAEMHVFDLGPAKVFNIEASGTELRRTPRMSRQMNECEIVLAMPMRTDNHMLWEREERLFGPRDMMLVDVSAPYVYGWSGHGASYAFHVDVDHLGLPMDTVRRATKQLHGSPLYDLVRDHISRVTTQAAMITESGAAVQVGVASTELMRALIVSSAGDTRLHNDVMHDALASRVQAFVRNHLGEPDLGPARIAAAHNISLRTLYKLYEGRGTSLEQSIIEQRLEGARADLAASRQRYASIAATARAWGFTNPSFFAQRFRREFGVTPRQVRTGAVPG